MRALVERDGSMPGPLYRQLGFGCVQEQGAYETPAGPLLRRNELWTLAGQGRRELAWMRGKHGPVLSGP